MARQVTDLGTISIANAGTTSGGLSGVSSASVVRVALDYAIAISIFSPAALTGTVTVQVSPVESPAAGDWKALSVGGADVTIPAAKAVILTSLGGFKDLRLVSGSAEAAQRDFIVRAQLALDT